LHQIFSDPARLAHITEGCTQATITCVECKALAIQSVNAHLAPILERRHALAQNPSRLMEIIQHGGEKAGKTAEETMVGVRDAVGLLKIGAVERLAAIDESANLPRVPESIADAKTEEERWTIRTADWLERISTTYPLKKDRPRTFITRKGRKVGVYAAAENNGVYKFELEDRPLNVLVLLTQATDRSLCDFILPPKVLQDHWKQFPRHNGSVQIELHRSANGASLALPQGDLSVEQYKGDYSALQ
jgi:hypothetical protein